MQIQLQGNKDQGSSGCIISTADFPQVVVVVLHHGVGEAFVGRTVRGYVLALLHVEVGTLGGVLALSLPVASVSPTLALAPLLSVGRGMGEELGEVGEPLEVLLQGLEVRGHERVESREVETWEARWESRHPRVRESSRLLPRAFFGRLLWEDWGDGRG